MSDPDKKTIGRILIEQQAVSPAALETALAQDSPLPIASRLIETGALTELEALKALSTQRGVPGIDLNQVCIKLSDLNVLPREIALRHKLLPVLEREDRIFCAMANPEDKKALEELEFVTGKRIFAYIALERALLRVIRDAYDLKERNEQYYAGADCPADVLARVGIVRAPAEAPVATPPAPAVAAPPQRSGPPPVPRPAPRPPPPPPPAAAKLQPPSMKPTSRSSDPIGDPADRTQAAGLAGRERRFRPSSTTLAAVPTQVVIDDKMSKHIDTEVSEADFGDVARELSVVAEFPKEPPPKPEATAGKKKLLVVDDELEIRKLLRRVLEESGYAVVEADRGRTALQALKVEAPDLVILDAMLPEIHGFDIARRIRGSTRFAHVPIIMVSAVYRGWRIAEDVKTNYGVDAYIEKPFRVADVLAAVEQALKARKQPVDAERISAEAEQLLNDGVAAYRAGDLERATELLVQGTKVDPLAYRLRFHLGLLYGKRGQVYDAIQQLERAVEIQGKHFASVKNLAILYQQAGFKNKAVEAWQRALHIAPDEDTRKTIKEHLVGLL
ncbi:MAG: response regulator [Polyangiaceae bacterium]